MTTLRPGMTLVLASHNEGKIWEFGELLSPFEIKLISAAELGLPEPEETGETFAANAKLKSVAAAKAAKLPALGDDSGLEVAALGGAPGVLSARWGGSERDFGAAMTRVHNAMKLSGSKDTRANFISVLALSDPSGATETYEGKVFGNLTWPPRGSLGFGYDPIFVPDGFDETFGEMDPDFKNAMSHRARAFEQLMLEAYDDE